MPNVPKLMQRFSDGSQVFEVVGVYYGPAVILKNEAGCKITTGVEGHTFQSMTPINDKEPS
jgi:hypothetical protein